MGTILLRLELKTVEMFGIFKLNSYFCNGIKYRLMVHVNETIVMFLYVLSKHQSNTRPLALFPPIFSIILIFFPSDLHFSKNNRTFALEDAIVR